MGNKNEALAGNALKLIYSRVTAPNHSVCFVFTGSNYKYDSTISFPDALLRRKSQTFELRNLRK